MYILITIIATLVCSALGWHKGILRMALWLAALMLAYAFAWQESPAFSSYIIEKGWLSGLLVWPAASLALFLVGSVGFSTLARLLFYLAPEHWKEGRGKWAGALAGAAMGCLLGLLMVWAIGALQDAWRLRVAQQPAPAQGRAKPEAAVSFNSADRMVRDLSGDVMAVMAQRALGEGATGTAVAHWVRQPLAMSEELKYLMGKPELRQLFENPANYNVLAHGSTADIQRLPAFQSLTGDTKVMQFLSAAGLPGEALPQQSQALAGMLSRYAGNFEKLRKTPEFQALAQDPELRMKWQQGNVLALLTDDKMRRLAAMLANGEQQAGAGAANGVGPAGSEEFASPGQDTRDPKKPEENLPRKILYQWKDEKGRVHFTEEKPPEGVKADVIQP